MCDNRKRLADKKSRSLMDIYQQIEDIKESIRIADLFIQNSRDKVYRLQENLFDEEEMALNKFLCSYKEKTL